MKKLLLIFAGFLILVTMLGLLFFSGAIYDTEEKHTIETFFFEPNTQPERRIKTPVSADDVPENFLRDILISRFVNEYFYVIPDTENANTRTALNSKSILRTNARAIVAEKWLENVAPQIEELSAKNAYRTARVTDISKSESGHLVIKYELKTWLQPNNILEKPEVTEGYLYLHISSEPIKVRQTQEALDKLEQGYDPMSAFSFGVLDVEQD